ncbi:HolB ATPase involved in DNA replication [uncultured Caudovirales phage]|uniref:Sliding-clamp-loader large subunit n=1 Tax=uncultured Caudovirales phage TaxID=2100421 RepID=A0A6J5LHC7_9CAUD|nr:HolB ATPase involved in DNA replication [uncultured Caudovirales phage]
MKELWTEKYRPSTIDGYVFTDPSQREQIEYFIKEKSIPHLMLSGPAGTGKTTLAKILVNCLGIESFDFLQVNASRDNGVDFLKSKIEGFVSTMPFGDLKIVLLDEADYLSHNAQAILRGLMETYQSQARFILTCNLAHKIIAPLKSRCQQFVIDKTDPTEFTTRVATVLLTEEVEFDIDVLDSYVKATYPDLRKCLNLLQANSVTGKLLVAKTGSSSTSDYKLTVVDLFKQGKIREARTVLCRETTAEEMEELYRWMYDNLSLWSETPEGQDQAIVEIRQGLVNHAIVADPEINLSATLVKLSQIL